MYSAFDLTGHRSLITGGNGGIGMGMAKALLDAGATVSIWGARAEKTAAARDALVDRCGDKTRVHALTCDVGDEAQVEAAMAQTLTAIGGVDSCFANAGVIGHPTRMIDMDLAEFQRVQRVNVEGVFLTCRAAARAMIAQGRGGSLVVTSSTAAVEGAARNSHYGASKGAVASFVRAIAMELARHQIRVNSILPGWIETDMTEGSTQNEKFAQAIMPRIPARRWGQWDDFGGIAVYLASAASSYHTGDQFMIDGGYSKF